jgi:hypothetical protein
VQDLITALQIFAKYTDSAWPTGCEHDTLYVYVDPVQVSKQDLETLATLGFITDEEKFMSFRFGSA